MSGSFLIKFMKSWGVSWECSLLFSCFFLIFLLFSFFGLRGVISSFLSSIFRFSSFFWSFVASSTYYSIYLPRPDKILLLSMLNFLVDLDVWVSNTLNVWSDPLNVWVSKPLSMANDCYYS